MVQPRETWSDTAHESGSEPIFAVTLLKQYTKGVGEFETVMQTRDAVKGLHNLGAGILPLPRVLIGEAM